MRLSIIGDEIDQDLLTVARDVRDRGLTGVEIRSVGNVRPHELTDDRLREIREVLAVHGLRVAGFCPPALKQPLPRTDAEVASARALLARSVEQARVLGSPHVRIFTFYREGEPDPRGAAAVAREVLSGLVPGDGVRLLVETGTRTNTPTVALTLRFLDALGRDDLGVLWDPGNSVFSGAEPVPFPGEYFAARELIGHVHVKDPAGTTGYVRLGDGDLPWAAIIGTLAADGYTGWLSLETHWRQGRTLTQRERDEPWGDAFSRGGRQASAECMRELVRLAT
ncbi:sugar phosphate isomerase/epimerase family protein [Spongiactinospora sp. TRM90649]|uniref:sugar phosphate isomerase/epimerase family protein n=1 Tax=Spongiactinospora sp. TRM90649 TaxID=3031114 RepID=UPI0023F75C03|nr:sugar phosphate isomerase/epimerase family protein [Spongiactinospora sp. TRM90649]MDF5757689.1 sugar phosphate isomerase/epimerase [Spongiactinospora sp. TRM90649]